MIIHTLKILIEYEDADVTSQFVCFLFTFYIATKSLNEQGIIHPGITNYHQTLL